MSPSTPSSCRGFPASALWRALFVLTLRQHLRGRRLLVLSLLFALPSVLVAVVTLLSPHPPPADEIKFAFVFNMIPHALAPLAALLYATGIIQDEVEEQTLTYLLLQAVAAMAALHRQARRDIADGFAVDDACSP